ncbi:PhzF family phenazine biosynthesis protein [Alkaliphilus transvaalensis]|uniref:PhzF family phenazine biosynthesis protein n=1 Tax=Alkaliphilus transvaalensis TaxID=114628 RepID=UPI00047B37D6|nr:PhzF family phenazine biosynthesis protein [Alkaliphilus transvaalensis]
MIRKKRFLVVNSFSLGNKGGNPAAIFCDGEGISQVVMQEIAKQLNLVETVFVLPSKEKDIDFQIKYFTPSEEIALAGHPTIAAFVALLKEGRIKLEEKNEYSIQTLKGRQFISGDNHNGDIVFTMKFPEPMFIPLKIDKKKIARILELSEEDLLDTLPVEAVDTGLGHLIIPVKSLNALMKIKRNTKVLKEFCSEIGVREIQAFTFETIDQGVDIHTRNICPREGVEDPACGVGNSAVGSYLLKNHYLDQLEVTIKAEQGHIVEMPSLIEIKVNRNGRKIEVFVGGSGRVVIEGDYILG